MSRAAHHSFDVLVLGGGTAGCVIAARLSEDTSRTVCLVEAGPDYGPASSGRWPADLLDARRLAFSHDWGYEGGRDVSCARVLGGCSAHNACVVVRGAPADYDEWEPLGWGSQRLEPYVRRARETLSTRSVEADELAPWHRAVLAAGSAAGFPLLPDADAGPIGVAVFPRNARGTTRWNAAFAYLDAARERPNLTIRDETLVDRLEVEGDRVRAVVARHRGEELRLEAGLVVLAAGAFGSPAVLLRSGVGPAADLERLGVRTQLDLPGVGEGLADHAGVGLEWATSEALERETAEHEEQHGLTEAQTLVKASSSSCPPDLFDIHLLPWVNARPDGARAAVGRYQVTMAVFAMKPASRGRVTLRSADPEASPAIEHRFLADPADAAVIVDGIRCARRLADAPPLRRYRGEETRPGADADLDGYVREAVRGYFHPVGTCRMGHPGDREAVVDPTGRVRGVANLAVADASIMPTIPRANTNLTVAALAEGLAEALA